MIPVSALHYDILQQANHTNSQYLNELTVGQRDYYLNRGKDIVFEWLTSQDENNDTVRRYLQQLVKRNVKLSLTDQEDKYLAAYPPDFFKQKALYAIAKRDGCTAERRLTIRRPTSEKLQAGLKNSNSNRFWDFEQTFAQESDQGLLVYKEAGVTYDVFMDYIRKVKDVAYPSGEKSKQYINSAGQVVSVDQNLELDSAFFHNKIVNMAVLQIKRDYTSLSDYQAERDFILNIDRT